MEGGGDSHESKAALRQGMDAFLTPLKEAARSRSWRWKLVCCGPRQQTFEAFIRALQTGEMAVTALLIDAEGPVVTLPCAHLQSRDGWDLSGVADDVVHLMIQTMETWIVADPLALRAYYGLSFNANRLSRAKDLEAVPRRVIASTLDTATRATQKGVYRKIRHASDLLKRIDRERVKQRCPSCMRLFDRLRGLMEEA